MEANIHVLVKAYRFKVKIEIAGKGNPGFDLFLTITKMLKVDFNEIELQVPYTANPIAWFSDHSTKNLRVWIPELKDRESDIHVLLPFCFQYHVHQLRQHDPEFMMPEVDNLYLLLIWSVCFGKRQMPISAKVYRDLLAWETHGQITAFKYRGSIGDEIAVANRKAWELPKRAQMYLGLLPGVEGQKLLKNSELKDHPFNQQTNEMLGMMLPGIGGNSTTIPPYMIRQYTWRADKTSVALKNSWLLQYRPVSRTDGDESSMEACLEYRLREFSEDQVAVNLNFQSIPEYVKWQIKHGIDIDTNRHGHHLSDWLSSCKDLGIEPSDDMVESLTGKVDQDESVIQESQKTAPTDIDNDPSENDPIPGFRFSPDFRSLRLPNRESRVLSEKQSQVIQFLYDMLLNSTPEISQALIIEEVYGRIAENNLRKVFGDKILYDEMIERGSKRGLVKLRTIFK